jgi:hypothetical protein
MGKGGEENGEAICLITFHTYSCQWPINPQAINRRNVQQGEQLTMETLRAENGSQHLKCIAHDALVTHNIGAVVKILKNIVAPHNAGNNMHIISAARVIPFIYSQYIFN